MRVIEKVAAMVIQNNAFLMVRKKGKETWTNLGGHREGDETEEIALLREIDEELGCRARIIRKLGDFEAPAVHDPGATVRLATYLVELTGEPVLQDPELEEWTFVGHDYRKRGIQLPPSIEQHVLPHLIREDLLAW